MVARLQLAVFPQRAVANTSKMASIGSTAAVPVSLSWETVREGLSSHKMIIIKSKREIAEMRAASRIVAQVLLRLKDSIEPGVSTKELDSIAETLIGKAGAVPAFKGYRGYPASLCTAVNEQVIHGIPGARRIEEGDIVGLDVGVEYNGFFGDGAITVPVGEVDGEKSKLLQVAEQALYEGLKQARPGRRLFDISFAIQSHVERNSFSVVREFTGHGIGRELHEEPQIPNFGEPNRGPRLKPGMTLAIEPMVNAGSPEVAILEDGWTAVTADGKPSAHFEHTVAITESDPDILTLP